MMKYTKEMREQIDDGPIRKGSNCRVSSILRSVALLTLVLVSSTANAAIASIFGVGAVSFVPAAVLATNAVIAKDPKTGQILAIGASVVTIIDPPAATFYNGSFSIYYDPTLLQLSDTGFLGSWGADPTLPAPPVDWTTWTDSTFLNLQAPNALLSAIVDTSVAGIVTTTFDWGSEGHAATDTDAFNFNAALFTVKHDSVLTYLGDAPNGQVPSGANFYVQTPGVFCSLPNDNLIQTCGETTTSYYQLTLISEPPTLMLVGLALINLFWRSRLREHLKGLTLTSTTKNPSPN